MSPSPLLRQFFLRLSAVLGVAVLITAAVCLWIYRSTNDQATRLHLASAQGHYTAVISNLERRWGREAFNLKARLESHRFLDDLPKQRESLLAYLTAQGGSIEFPALRIEDSRGDVIVSFEHSGGQPPKVRFLPGQEYLWVIDATNDRLFMVFRQVIWLGKENGYLLLFRPLDHALLTQQSYPETRLSLWWQDTPVASSEGEEGLSAAARAWGKADKTSVSLPWSNTDRENCPVLFIESTSPPLLSLQALAVPLLVSLLAFLLLAWLAAGRWTMQTLKRMPPLPDTPGLSNEQR